ncbi:Alpha/Beta hydrolase protein [Sordaria brevicollis]|uniref:Alpha/Beta hydrolase protein n=1 Tax=Sordaria brevicollis TaxID=83679 RepID=A0AAE0UDF5_SORBR|nr:Alpha/Beta hydrolase protein [Sordaria brevicollis]
MAAITSAVDTAVDTAGPTGSEETHVAPPWPLMEKLKYGALAYGITKLVMTPMNMITAIKTDYLGSSPNKPDLVKTMPSRTMLPVRVFLPKSHSPSNPERSKEKLPTLLTIHGGGFVLGSPYDNDGWNRRFVELTSDAGTPFCVIALDYRKAPSYPFPTAIHDLEAVILDLLGKPSTPATHDDLPIDTDRVAIAGWSAGGNLSLSVSQLPDVKPLIKAVIPMYPVVDFVTPSTLKAKARRYKPALGGFRGRNTDFLTSMMNMFNWSYVSPGQNMSDPLLSPFYAIDHEKIGPGTEHAWKKVIGREKFPSNVFIVACELDLLANEAWRLACKLSDKEVPGVEETIGREEPGERGKCEFEDERFHWWDNLTVDGKKWRYRWLLVPDVIHGYDHENIGSLIRDEEAVKDGLEKREEVMEEVRQWLLDGIF